MKKNYQLLLKNLSWFIIISLFITSCASQYQVSTNLDQENFQRYFSPTEVTIYQDESEIKTQFRYLAAVEGESCQVKAHHQPANEIAARTDARRKAFNLGANAIVFSGCTLIENNIADKQCVTTRVCYGKSYQVEKAQNE